MFPYIFAFLYSFIDMFVKKKHKKNNFSLKTFFHANLLIY